MSVVSFQTHYGGASTVGIHSTIPSSSLSILSNQSSRSSSIIPSVSIYGNQTSGAISNIIDLIAGMDNSDASEAASHKLSKDQKNIGRLHQMEDWASWTQDDVIDFLTSDLAIKLSTDKHSIAFREAINNGTATIVDMEEYGYRTEAAFNVHFDAEGNHAGESVTFIRGEDEFGFDLNEFYEKHLIRQADGSIIDGETGMFSGRVKVGAFDLFITWPRESEV